MEKLNKDKLLLSLAIGQVVAVSFAVLVFSQLITMMKTANKYSDIARKNSDAVMPMILELEALKDDRVSEILKHYVRRGN